MSNMTFIPLFGPITKLSLSFITFRVSHFPVSHLTYEIVKLDLQNTLNTSKLLGYILGCYSLVRIKDRLVYQYGSNSSTANDCIDVSLRSTAQQDRIGSAH